MGKPCFSKLTKFFAFALLGTATAIAAIAVLSTPAAAHNHGGGGDSDDYPWDTDNLRYGSYNARSFNIPFHKYSGYSGVAACQKNVADGFFQTDNSVVNDFPVLVSSGSGDNVTWSVAAGSAGNDAGCDTFVAQQDKLAAQVAAGLTYVLSEDGKVASVGGSAFTTGRSVSDLNYVTWTAKGSPDYTIVGTHGATKDSRYLRRADGIYNNRRLAITPYSAGDTITVPSGASTGNFGAAWHASRSDQLVGGVYYDYYKVSLYPSLARHLTKTKSDDLCIGDFHPRGEDSYQRIGGNTGRSLTGLSHAAGRTADRFWCRSDVRYERRFKAEHHTGVTEAQRHPQARNMAAGTVFSAYGRLGCYYTSIGAQGITGTTASKCDYHFPLPKCDPNPGNGSDSDWRNYTNREIQSSRLYGKIFTKADGDPCATQCTHNGAKRDMTSAEILEYIKDNPLFVPNTDGTTPCVKSDGPPQQAGFTADACVTADLEIYENRIVGSAAEPGVAATDRTLAVAAGRTAWDLDITSPHPLTASPPRDTTAGSGDPDGCADGSEGRADHASSPAGAARKQSPAPSYAASDRTNTAAPPNDADGDIDYSGAAKNMAHRYASRVAENTCAAKLAEAEAELSLLELREDGFAQWLSDYKTAADTNASRYSSYTRTPQQSGSGLAILRFNDTEANKATYAALLATRYTNLSSALSAAKTAYDTATDRTAGSSRAAVIAASSNSGCTAHYTAEIARLKTLFANAETAAANRIRAAQTAVTQTRLVSPAAIANNDSAVGYSVPDISAVLARTETTRECADDWNPPFCSRPAEEGEECGIFGCAGTWTTTTTSYYTCPGGTYSVAGRVSRSYKGTRSASYSTTYTAAGRSTESTSRTCPSWTSARTSGYSYAAYSDAVAYVMGTPGTASSLPSVATASAHGTLRALGKASLLGSYYLSHGDRANLEATADADRNTAGGSLSVSVGSVPSGSPQKIEDYQTAYKTAYDTAYSQAEGHMSGTAWNNFDWRYHSTSLTWSNYQEDPATTYSASTATPRDGTGCDLVAVASDGSVSVEATRLDYETSSYGKGSVYSTRTDAQRTCKIRRTRTPNCYSNTSRLVHREQMLPKR